MRGMFGVLLLVIVVSLYGCGMVEEDYTQKQTSYNDDYMELFSIPYSDVVLETINYRKDGTKEVWLDVKAYHDSTWKESKGRPVGYYYNLYKELYNVTPEDVRNTMSVNVFDCGGITFIENRGKLVTIIGRVFSMVPWDYDMDGNMDLLLSSISGSGFTFVEMCVYNTKTDIVHSVYFEKMQNYMCVAGARGDIVDIDGVSRCYVHNVFTHGEVENETYDKDSMEENHIYMSTEFLDMGVIGYVEYKDGKFVFEDYNLKSVE